MSKDATITTKDAPEPRGPYVHARQHGALVYVTAQIGRDPKTGDFVKGGFEAEFNQAIDNVEAILRLLDPRSSASSKRRSNSSTRTTSAR